MKKTKYYCDLCEKEDNPLEFIHIEIKVAHGYNSDRRSIQTKGGIVDLNICQECASGLKYVSDEGGKKWSSSVREMFLSLVSMFNPSTK
jgi:hypothetical protein